MKNRSRTVLGIDPGDVFSGLVEWDGARIIHAMRIENKEALHVLMNTRCTDVAIEEIVLWGKGGKNISGAIKWSGRFEQAAEFMGLSVHSLYRKTIAAHLTGLAKYGDTKIRAALIERFGPPPSKGCDNPVYNGCKIPGKKNDKWAAWAVAVTWWDKNCGGW